jgi:diguanylate cyclase (GGDEF)-like protein
VERVRSRPDDSCPQPRVPIFPRMTLDPARPAPAAADGDREALARRLRECESELERLNRYDELTGLLNRRSFRRTVIAHLGGAARYGTPLSVARIDVDRLKLINDIGGALRIGDEVLRRTAEILRGTARDGDVFGRWAGDELAAVFPYTAKAAALAACERLRAAVAAEPWERVHPHVRVTISIGVGDRADGVSADRLLAAADQRVDRAKWLGRDRVVG